MTRFDNVNSPSLHYAPNQLECVDDILEICWRVGLTRSLRNFLIKDLTPQKEAHDIAVDLSDKKKHVTPLIP